VAEGFSNRHLPDRICLAVLARPLPARAMRIGKVFEGARATGTEAVSTESRPCNID